MKVLMIGDQPNYTGIGNYSDSLFKALIRLNYEVKYHSIFNNNSNTRLNRLFDYLSLLRLPKGFDIYHYTNPMTAFSSFFHSPSVVTIHDLCPYFSDDALPVAVKAGIKINMKTLSKAKSIICISNNTKKDLLKFLNIEESKIHVVLNGVDHDLFKPRNKEKCRIKLGLPLDKKIVLNIGTELQRKNIPTLIKVIKEMGRDDVLLVRLGQRGSYTQRVIKNNKLEKKIVYISPKKEDVPYYYNAADVYVSTSSYEGFGFPILEAMASRCPVVSANNSSIPEIAGKSCILVDTFNLEGYIEHIDNLLNDENKRALISEQGYQRSLFFNWKKCAIETFRIYGESMKTP